MKYQNLEKQDRTKLSNNEDSTNDSSSSSPKPYINTTSSSSINNDDTIRDVVDSTTNGGGGGGGGDDDKVKPTFKRYFILIMYGICSMQKSFQWINLSTITNKVALYYDVDNMAVNWTSVLFMITFIPLVLPTGWLIERIGLRRAVLIGSSGIALGAIVKCFACHGDRFWVVIWGQIIVSLSEQFIFCIPARIASVWFPDHQVSLATGFGIFGNQCGIALGFLIPQAILDGLETREQIGTGLYRLFWWTAIVASATWLVLVALFDDRPKHAPGLARWCKINQEREERQLARSFWQEMRLFGRILRQLMQSVNCDLLVLAYGINVGTGYAIQTLLNQFIASPASSASSSSLGSNDLDDGLHAQNGWTSTTSANEIVGNSGLIVIFCGMIGALFWGHLCDLTHRYILITRSLYLGAIVSLLLFGFTLRLYQPLALYGASALMGFMLIGYTVAGLDTIVELTYPVPELVSTSVMNLSPQIFGTGITFAASYINDTHDNLAAIGFLVGCLTVGLIVTILIKEQLKRQTAVNETEKSRLAAGAAAPAASVFGAASCANGACNSGLSQLRLAEIS